MLSRCFFLSSLFLEFLLYSSGQPSALNREKAMAFEEKGKYWREMAQYDSSLSYYQQAASLYWVSLNDGEDSPTWESYLLCQAWMGENFSAIGQYDSALYYGFRVERLADQELGPYNKATAQACNLLGSTFLELSDYPKSQAYHQKALDVRKAVFGETHLEVSHSYENLGNTYSTMGNYEQALDLHQKALTLRSLAPNPNSRFLAYSHINLGFSHSDLGAFERAISHYLEAERYLADTYPPEHPNFGIIYNNLGVIYQDIGDYSKALEYLQKTRKIYLAAYGASSRQLMDWELNMGNLHFDNGDYLQAKHHWETALDRLLTFPHPPQRKLRSVYQNLSMALNELGDKKRAESYQLKSLELAQMVFPDKHHEIASNYSNLGLIAQDQGKYSEAINLFLKALDIQLESLPYPHPDIGRTYSNLGMIEQVRGNFQEAKRYLETALEIYLQFHGELHENVAIVYTNMGAVLVSEGNYEVGRSYLEKSNDIYRALFGPSHSGIASNLSNFGFILEGEGKQDSAALYYQKALAIYRQVYPGFHYDIAKLEKQVGDIQQQNGSDQEARYWFDQAWEHVGFQQDKPFDFSYLVHDGLALQVLQSRIRLLKESAGDTLSHLYEADSLLAIGFQLLDEFRKKLSFEESELSLQHLVIPLFELGVNTQVDLFNATQERRYLAKAFYFAEKSKSYLLQRRIRLAKNMEFSGVPDTLLQREGRLQLAFSFYQRELRRAIHKDSSTELQESIRKKLWAVERQIDSLNTYFLQKHPGYYEWKYSDAIASLDQVEAFLERNPHTTLVSYFWGNESGVVFTITQDSTHLAPFSIPQSLIWEMRDFYGILSGDSFVSNEASFLEGRKKYAKLGHSLFKKLLPDGLPNSQKFPHLHIIPDGILGYIPFETLLGKAPLQPYSYKNFPYLLRDYDISYNYSVSLWIQEQSDQQAPSRKYGGFAPSYSPPQSMFPLEGKRERWESPVGSFTSLQFNQPEVQYVTQLMEGVSFLGAEATESKFKEVVKELDILHLAMHGFFDESDPFQSGLVFSQESDSLNDGFLYAHELYGMELSLDLAVLSACHAGIGSLARGEGIMSLSRAFKYAGCPNIIGSHWQADDKSSQFLLADLFTYLSQDQPRALSLQQAKLSFLHKSSEVKSHPFFWAAWVLMGHSDPPTLPWYYKGYTLLLLAIFLCLGGYFLLRFPSS